MQPAIKNTSPRTLKNMGTTEIIQIVGHIKNGVSTDILVEDGIDRRTLQAIIKKYDIKTFAVEDAPAQARRLLFQDITGGQSGKSLEATLQLSGTYITRVIHAPEGVSTNALDKFEEQLRRQFPDKKEPITALLTECRATKGPSADEIKSRAASLKNPLGLAANATDARSREEFRQAAGEILREWREECGQSQTDILRKTTAKVSVARLESAQAKLDDDTYLKAVRELCRIYTALKGEVLNMLEK